MHGVPIDLDLAFLHGSTLQQICLAQFIIYFRFDSDPRGEIGVEGDWELRDSTGTLLDQQEEPTTRQAYRLNVLLGKEVVSSDVSPPRSFTLLFNSGHRLQIYDNSPQYESFSIQPGNIFV